MKREPRNPDMKYKPAVISWFKNRHEAKAYFEPVKDFLVQHYSSSNHGFINKKAYPEYRFNSIGSGEIYVVIRVSQNHVVVRVRISHDKVGIEFSDYCKTVASKHGKRIDVIDFTISKTSDLKIMADFFISHEINNFILPKFSSWKKFEINSEDNYKTIRLLSGGEVEVTHAHLELSKKFIKWLRNKGLDAHIQEEYILANLDKIDVRFSMNGKCIFSELKTVAGSSTKRAIREALGQILDYQYYGNTEMADELWIVVNDVCTESDIQFIELLIERHKFPLRLVWEKKRGFESFPDLTSFL